MKWTHMGTFLLQNGALRDIELEHCRICATSIWKPQYGMCQLCHRDSTKSSVEPMLICEHGLYWYVKDKMYIVLIKIDGANLIMMLSSSYLYTLHSRGSGTCIEYTVGVARYKEVMIEVGLSIETWDEVRFVSFNKKSGKLPANIAAAKSLATYHLVKYLQLTWSLANRRRNLWVAELKMSYSVLT